MAAEKIKRELRVVWLTTKLEPGSRIRPGETVEAKDE